MRYKFKLWDKREKRWETIRSIGLDEDGSAFYIQCWDEAERDIDPPYFMDNLGVGFELIQYTGLTDKNGVEIYEGDIIHCRYLSYIEFNAVVRFGKYEQDGSAGEYTFSTCVGFYAEAINKDKKDDWGIRIVPEYAETASLSDFDRLEVIGNIYQHKHLLKENEK